MASIGSTRIDDTATAGKGIVLFGSELLNVDPSEAIIISQEVPVGKIWRIQYAEIACRGFGRWKIKIDDVIVGGGLSGPAREHDRTNLPDFFDAASGQTIDVVYLYCYGPNAMPVESFVGIIEI